MANAVSKQDRVQNEKEGGPYTKDERTKRQNEVARLHFEYGYSAVKIADMMKVNRNTINSDIRYLYSGIKEELKQNTENIVLKQIARLEAQRTRIVKQIEKGEVVNIIKQEKLLLDVDSKINSFLIKINTNNENKEPDLDIQDKKIKEFVLYMLVKYNRHGKQHGQSDENIASEIINIWRCSAEKAEKIQSYLDGMGLKYCQKRHEGSFVYDFLEFVFMQRYVCPEDVFLEDLGKLHATQQRCNSEVLELGFLYDEKYGKEERWSKETFERYEQECKEISKKHEKNTKAVTARLLGSFLDQESHEMFTKFLDVFFAEKSLQTIKTVDVVTHHV